MKTSLRLIGIVTTVTASLGFSSCATTDAPRAIPADPSLKQAPAPSVSIDRSYNSQTENWDFASTE